MKLAGDGLPGAPGLAEFLGITAGASLKLEQGAGVGEGQSLEFLGITAGASLKPLNLLTGWTFIGWGIPRHYCRGLIEADRTPCPTPPRRSPEFLGITAGASLKPNLASRTLSALPPRIPRHYCRGLIEAARCFACLQQSRSTAALLQRIQARLLWGAVSTGDRLSANGIARQSRAPTRGPGRLL